MCVCVCVCVCVYVCVCVCVCVCVTFCLKHTGRTHNPYTTMDPIQAQQYPHKKSKDTRHKNKPETGLSSQLYIQVYIRLSIQDNEDTAARIVYMYHAHVHVHVHV